MRGAALLALSLLTWGSWNEPNLHDYPAPVQVSVLQVADLQPGPAAIELRSQLLQLPGITACTVSADAHSVVYTYCSNETTPLAVQAALTPAFRLQPYQVPAAATSGPQCPMPAGYVVALERLRFAFNLRRLFVRV